MDFCRPLIPNGKRRARWHDYRSRCIYLVTLNRSEGLPAFSRLCGKPGDHHDVPRAVNSPLGEAVSHNLSALKTKWPQVSILRRSIMPEHIHFVIFIKADGCYHLGEVVGWLMRECSRSYARLCGRTEADVSVFEDGYNDRILQKQGQLQKMLAYVSANPLRRLERMASRGFFSRYKLRSADGLLYEAYGNIHLLDDPDIEAVRISRSYTPEELRRRKLCWLRTVENSGVLVSPFISEAERRVRDWATENGGRLIIIEENGFGPRYHPKGRLHELCSQGRLLLIAPVEYSYAKVQLSRQMCMAMNQLATEVAAGAVKRL